MKTLIKILCLSVLWFSCESDIHGCLDSQACNYNSNANIDNNSCEYPEPNYDCDDNCTVEIDCFDECGGIAELDDCGVCNGDGQDADQDGECDDTDDCIGEYDDCGICNGENGAQDCNGECFGNVFDEDNDGICDDIDECVGQYDDCGICNGNGQDADLDGICDDIDDCIGQYDECGICNGDGFSECWDGSFECNINNCPYQPFNTDCYWNLMEEGCDDSLIDNYYDCQGSCYYSCNASDTFNITVDNTGGQYQYFFQGEDVFVYSQQELDYTASAQNCQLHLTSQYFELTHFEDENFLLGSDSILYTCESSYTYCDQYANCDTSYSSSENDIYVSIKIFQSGNAELDIDLSIFNEPIIYNFEGCEE